MIDDAHANTVRCWMEYVHKTMARNIVAMGYPNGGKNAAPAERNISIPLAAKLIEQGYALYAEPTRSSDASKERIDLIAAKGDLAFVIETKRRTKNFDGMLADIKRIKDFQIQVAPPASDCIAVTPVFTTAPSKFGLFVSTNFEDESAFAECWKKLPNNPALGGKYKYVNEIVAALPNGSIFDCTDADSATEIFAKTGAFRIYWVLFRA